MTHRRWRLMVRVTEVAALVVVVAALAFCSWFRASGGHWERVETPSMGTTAPVGTLVWIRHVDAGDLRPGQIVTFLPPGHHDVFTHRITAIHDDGTFSTAGDLSGPDSWRVPDGDVVGKAQWLWPGAGWLVEAAPVLLLGGVVTWGLALLWRRQRRQVSILGAAVTATVAVVMFHPLTGAQQLSFEPVSAGAQASYVGTGLLPVRLEAPGDHDSVVLHPGEVGSVVTTHPLDRRLAIRLEPAVPLWFWVLLVAVCFAPTVAGAISGQEVRRRRGHRAARARPERLVATPGST